MDESSVRRYLEHVLPNATGVEVRDLRRILGGASRYTWSCDARWIEGGAPRERGLIFRIDPPASLLETDRALEYQVYRGLAGSSVIPAPEALWLEPDGEWLGAPFFVMERIDGCETSPQAMFREPYAAHGERLGVRLFEIGGAIAAFDWRGAGWTFLDVPAPGECWRRELDHWETVIERGRYDPQPIVRGAIDWLRRHAPPDAQRVTLVHGDHRIGNVLYDEEGAIHGVLDWEMAHLGDPIEDLAWTWMPDWRWGRLELAAGLIAEERALTTWEAASGLRVDRAAFHWWQVFSQVKAQGIWLTGERSFGAGKTDEIRLALIACLFKSREDRVLLDLLGWGAGDG